jgi:hypothetical protein
VKYKNIFPYNFVPETAEETGVYVCYNVSVPRVYNKTFKALTIQFYVFCHQSVIKMKQGIRTDLIAEEIDGIFNGTMAIGLPRMALQSVEPLNPVEKYHGLEIIYFTEDWNR